MRVGSALSVYLARIWGNIRIVAEIGVFVPAVFVEIALGFKVDTDATDPLRVMRR